MLGITFLLLLQIFANQGAYFVAETNSSWSGDKNCSIAQPPLQFANGKITADISNLQLADNATIWVGYYTSRALFEYFGCVRSNARGLKSRPGVTTGDPGQCYSACPKPMSYIGVCKNECYCLATVPKGINTTEHGCNEQCTNQPGVACGGVDTSGVQYVSLYRFIKRPETVQVDAHVGNCSVLDPSSGSTGEYAWEQCSKSFLVMCYAGNVWQSYDAQSNFSTWIASAARCFMNDSRPTTVTNSYSVGVTPDSQLWTGIMRSWVVFKSAGTTTRSSIRYGYMTKVDNSTTSYVLSFTDADSIRAVLCDTGTEQTNADSNTSIAVGVSVIVFILALSIAVTLFVLMKRGHIPYLFQYSKDPNTSQQPEPDNKYPDLNLPDEEETNHDYVVLEEHEKELDSLETDYDEIEDGNTRLNRGINNVYNTVQKDTNASYDHTFINGHIAISDNDNTYDTSVTSAIKANGIANDTGNIYNTTEKAEDDTYNHVNMKACTNDKQDNAYCVSNGQPGADNDGIYNSTADNCSSCTPITDNTYSKLKAVT